MLAGATALADPQPRAVAADPTLTSPISLPTTAALLRASKGESDVAIQASGALTRGDTVLFGGLKISGPIGGGSSSPGTTLATLDGLNDSTTAELTVAALRWKIAAPDVA